VVSSLGAYFRHAIAAALLLVAVAEAAEPRVVSKEALPVGQWIQDTLAPDEMPSYPLVLERGTFIRLGVRTIDIQVNMRLIGPDQKALRAGDQNFLFWLAELPGNYRIEVIGSPNRRASARYGISLQESRAAQALDQTRLAAQKLDDEAATKGNSENAKRERIQTLQRVRALWKEAGETALEADTLINIATNEYELGEPGEQVRAHCDEARAFARQAGDRYVEARALADKSRSLSEAGHTQAAISAKQEVLEIYRSLRDHRDEHVILGNLALNYMQVGDFARAAELQKEALHYWREIGEVAGALFVMPQLATSLAALGQPAEALELASSAVELARREKLAAREAYALSQLGHVHVQLGQLPQAVDAYQQSLAIWQKLGNRWRQGSTRMRLGVAYVKLGQTERGRDLLVQALLELRVAGDRGGELHALYELAQAERALGNVENAGNYVDQAIEIQETARRELIRDDWRTSYLATLRKTYELAVDLRMAMHRAQPGKGFDAEVLSVSERARARTLVELLASAGLDLERGADPKLLQKRHEIEAALKSQAEQQLRTLTGERRGEQATTAEAESARLTQQLREVQAQIRSSASSATWSAPQLLSGPEIGPRLLDEDTTLLEYWLGSEHSYVWVATPSSLKAHELPRQSEVEKLGRQAYAQLKSRSGGTAGATALARMLLDPVAGELKGKRLVIVADGVLQYIPFGALAFSNGAPVISRFVVASLPSASTLGVIRAEREARPSPPKLAAVLADPVYSKKDPRVSGKHAAARTSGELERSVKESGLVELNRLAGTRGEAAILRTLVGSEGFLEAIGFEANRYTVFNKGLGEYRILHFATHGLVNSVHPELSGLVLSLVDREGRAQDGFLQAHEIYQLKLGADLAVLSACQTALGKEIRGEGLMSLTRAFIAAGVPRVVASLWSIPDAATAELMKRFYRGIIKDGLTPAAALQKAQDSLRKERRWSAPYYWAGFILQGELN